MVLLLLIPRLSLTAARNDGGKPCPNPLSAAARSQHGLFVHNSVAQPGIPLQVGQLPLPSTR